MYRQLAAMERRKCYMTSDTTVYDLTEMTWLKVACDLDRIQSKPSEISRNLSEMMAIFGSPSLPIRFASTRVEFARACENEAGEWLYDFAQKVVPKPEWIA